jgi:hypothetical protein
MAERYYEKFLATFFAESDFSRALKLAFLVVKNIKEQDNTTKEVREELEWISVNTTKRLGISFYKAWNIVSLERNPRKLIEIYRGKGLEKKVSEFTVGQIVVEVQKAHQRMYELMGRIARKYDISIPIETSGDQGGFSLPVID